MNVFSLSLSLYLNQYYTSFNEYFNILQPEAMNQGSNTMLPYQIFASTSVVQHSVKCKLNIFLHLVVILFIAFLMLKL